MLQHTLQKRGTLGGQKDEAGTNGSQPAVGLADASLNGNRARAKGHIVTRRGLLIRRFLLAADLLALTLGLLVADLAFAGGEMTESTLGQLHPRTAFLLFLVTLPCWVVLAKLYGLYDRDEERADHSTINDVFGVFHLIVVGTGLVFVGAWFGGLDPDPSRLLVFAGLSFALVMIARACARAFGRRRATYLQNTVIVGTGSIAQMAARKLLQHPEYGINLVGFVDAGATNGRAGLEHVPVLGPPQQLSALIPALGVERVLVAFSSESHEEMLALVRSLRKYDVRIDIVPRLFEVVAPNAALHTVEGLPLVGLGPARISRSTRLIKRSIDIVGATFGLLLTAPIFAAVAFLIKRDSPGPVFFRQIRLGEGMREFEIFKFRTMKVGTNDEEHRRYIEATMASPSLPRSNGLYKLERTEAITKVGQWLRKNSLDELPQLINVLRGDMSLVGPRPCIPYETADFAPHHFERFLVPAGMTGLWQVTARAQSSFREALEMDVAYARAFSLGLDLRLLCETPLQVLGQRRTT